MYRRRRVEREKFAFGFDSFLDVVANVIGIIIRLILVAWVGARFYSSAMEKRQADLSDSGATTSVSPALKSVTPATEPDPLEKQVVATQRELDEARHALAARLGHLDAGRKRHADSHGALAKLREEEKTALAYLAASDRSLAAWRLKTDEAAHALEALRLRGRELNAEVNKLEKAPLPARELRYFAPVSRVVDGEELMFECQSGKVTYLDVAAFMHEIKTDLDDKRIREIAKAGSFKGVTQVVGNFRVRYQFDAEQNLFGAVGAVRVQLTRWVLEPAAASRGEAVAQALAAGSAFRRLVDGIDPEFSTVTLWVYPDSFALYRSLRDYLAERGVEVAARPLPHGAPIAGSIHGSKSRGQ